MRAPFELTDLAGYRAQGRAPELPVFISDFGRVFGENLTGAGSLVIPVWDLQAATTWDWSPIAGLEVLLALRDAASARARMFARALKAHSPRGLYCIDWTARPGERLSTSMAVRVS